MTSFAATEKRMALSASLERLISVSAPLWAGEAEVVRTYWDAPIRNVETDLLWLRRQASKEFNGSGLGEYKNMGVFLGPLNELHEVFPRIDSGVDRHHVLDLIEGLRAEFSHYVAFADVYDAIRPEGTPPLDPHKIEAWDDDVALTKLRHRHIAEHGAVGKRACRFTEGGYCTLFREGMRLAGRGGADDLIARACAAIYDDEFGHMLAGIVGLDEEDWSAADLALMGKLVVDQLRQRIRMRNAEFSHPLSEARVQAIYAGDIEPERFDYAKAEAALAAE
jgi:hypothetical protein